MRRFSMRSWLMMSAVGFGWAASASAVEPVSPTARRAAAILSTPAERLDIQLVSCTDDTACDTNCDGVIGECVGECDSGGCLFGDHEAFDLGTTILGEDSGWDVGGWLSAGYTNKSDGVLNTVPNNLNIHQAWLFAEKIADGSEGFDWGARVDAMYGLDADNTQSYGNPANTGWDNRNSFDHGNFGYAIPQAYGVVAYDKLSVKIGHFYTPAGYEVVPANGNFFYSHALAWNFTEPFTHTGALGTYTASDNVTLYGGWVAGWDTGFERFNNGSAFIGGATVKPTDDVSLTYITTIGNLGQVFAIPNEGSSHHLVATVALTDKLNYALSSDISAMNNFSSASAGNYLIYTINDKLSAGGRAEWLKVNGVSYQEVTAGVNIKPMANFVVRPEIRHQWSNGAQAGNNPLGNAAFADQTILGIDAILSF